MEGILPALGGFAFIAAVIRLLVMCVRAIDAEDEALRRKEEEERHGKPIARHPHRPALR